MVAWLRRSKGDQEDAGIEVSSSLGLDEATCLLGALQRWLERAEIFEAALGRQRRGGATLSPPAIHGISIGFAPGNINESILLATTMTMVTEGGATRRGGEGLHIEKKSRRDG